MTERRRTMIERVQDIQKIQQPQSTPNPDFDSVEIISDDIPETMPVAEVIDDLASVASQPAATASAKPKKDCEIFRPTNRPPMGVLIVRDDGSTNGEKFRLRAEATLIGREGCDIVIDNDPAISTRHAEIVRLFERGRFRWYIRDLGSTNGTFVRVFKTNLKHDQEWMIGSRRYRYRMAQFQEAEAATEPEQTDESQRHNSTMGWQAPTLEDLQKNQPSFVNLLPTGEEGQVLPFTGDKLKLGSDAAKCQLSIENDPYLSKVHALISQTTDGHWKIKDAKSVNGIWLRATSLPIERTCEFQVGEQRFLFCIV